MKTELGSDKGSNATLIHEHCVALGQTFRLRFPLSTTKAQKNNNTSSSSLPFCTVQWRNWCWWENMEELVLTLESLHYSAVPPPLTWHWQASISGSGGSI